MKIAYYNESNTFMRFVYTSFPIIIGRSKECSLSINFPTLSRKHASITHLNDRYFISNLSETNPLMLDGEELIKGELQHGCHIQMGELELWIELDGFPAIPYLPSEEKIQKIENVHLPEGFIKQPINNKIL